MLAVVLGGDSWAMRLGAAEVDGLAAAARRIADDSALTIRAVTSPRTAPGLADRLAAGLGPDAKVHDWRAGGDNPYATNLARAARVLVTGDSVSVLADAVATGTPVTVATQAERPWLRHCRRLAPGGNAALLAPPPDIPALHRRLVARGLARWGDDGLLHLDDARAAVATRHDDAAARARALLPCGPSSGHLPPGPTGEKR